jgi:hypothetical protein
VGLEYHDEVFESGELPALVMGTKVIENALAPEPKFCVRIWAGEVLVRKIRPTNRQSRFCI